MKLPLLILFLGSLLIGCTKDLSEFNWKLSFPNIFILKTYYCVDYSIEEDARNIQQVFVTCTQPTGHPIVFTELKKVSIRAERLR